MGAALAAAMVLTCGCDRGQGTGLTSPTQQQPAGLEAADQPDGTDAVRAAYHAVLDAAAGAQARVVADQSRPPWGPAGVLRHAGFDAPSVGPLLDEYGLDRNGFETEVAVSRAAAAALREAGMIQKLAVLTRAVEALEDDAVLDLSGTLDRRARDAYRMLACLAVDAEMDGNGGDAPAGHDAYTTVIAGLDAMARAQFHGAGDDAALSNMVLLRFTDGLVLDAIAAGHMTEDRARALLGSARIATDAQRERYLGIVSRQLPPENRQTMANYWHTTRDGRRLALAIEIYRGQHGGLPPTLDALTPEVLAEAPRDPWAADGRYVYRLDDASPLGYVLYSVGADGVNDGGVRDGPMLSPEPGTDQLLAPRG